MSTHAVNSQAMKQGNTARSESPEHDHETIDFGPWREPLDDAEDFEDLGDGECFVALSIRTATGASIAAAVERWLRMPHHYSLRRYIEETVGNAKKAQEGPPRPPEDGSP